jgi:hypothetical protein
MLGEDDGNISFPAGLDHPQDIPQDGSDNPMKKVLHIDDDEGSMLLDGLRSPFSIGFQFF